jgi:tight adherence protein C
MMMFLALPVGLMGPDWIIALLRRPYLAALRQGVPDALDLLVVCSEAEMGLESALEQVSREIAYSNPAMEMALGGLPSDMRVLPTGAMRSAILPTGPGWRGRGGCRRCWRSWCGMGRR